jgi:hypothetical protein
MACSISGAFTYSGDYESGTYTTVGAGEYIVRTMLAHAVGESISTRISDGLDVDPHEILRSVLVEKFWGESWVDVSVQQMELNSVIRTLSK